MCNDSSRNRVHKAFFSYLLADQLAGRATSNNCASHAARILYGFGRAPQQRQQRSPPFFPLPPPPFFMCVCVCVCVRVHKVPSRFL